MPTMKTVLACGSCGAMLGRAEHGTMVFRGQGVSYTMAAEAFAYHCTVCCDRKVITLDAESFRKATKSEDGIRQTYNYPAIFIASR